MSLKTCVLQQLRNWFLCRRPNNRQQQNLLHSLDAGECMEQLALVHVFREELVLQVHVEHLQDLEYVLVETLELLEVRLGNEIGY